MTRGPGLVSTPLNFLSYVALPSLPIVTKKEAVLAACQVSARLLSILSM